MSNPEAKPSYSYINWIAMLFSAGLGIGLLFYGVAEPIMHLNSYPGMINGDISYNAGKAIGLANLHWGLHGWAIYSSLGLCFAFASYNKKLPFRVSSLLGEKVASVFNQYAKPGTYTATWDGKDINGASLPSGLYIYELDAGVYFNQTKKMTLVK